MPSPPPWPTRPSNSQDFDVFWLVRGIPPEPFPDESYDYAADPRFGPPGTRWVFSIESLVNRQTAPGTAQGTKLAIERLLRKLGTKLPPAGSTSWTTPLAFASPATPIPWELDEPMDWIRTQIVGSIGSDEQMVHVLNWRHSTTENAPIDQATLQAVAVAVRNGFQGFLAATASGAAVRAYMPGAARYREVRAASLSQAGPDQDPVWGPQTAVAPFDTNAVGSSQFATLPYEVAMGISLNTNFRGTSRFRGRLYFGPLASNCMGSDGQFQNNVVNGIGTAFGVQVVEGVKASTDYELHIVSQLYNTSAQVTGIRMGETPDSQRRRRRSRPEAYDQVWGTAVGGA